MAKQQVYQQKMAKVVHRECGLIAVAAVGQAFDELNSGVADDCFERRPVAIRKFGDEFSRRGRRTQIQVHSHDVRISALGGDRTRRLERLGPVAAGDDHMPLW